VKKIADVIHSDVLVIGSGGAGLRTAIELFDNKVDVLVVGKCKKRDAHTIMATGGINAALANMDKNDSWQLYAADTIRDGGYINDSDAVKFLCKDAPRAIKELARWGVKFHKERSGKISQRFFGAATFRRACFVGDHTGKAILNTLINQTLKRGIRFRSEVYIFALLTNDGAVNGALGLDLESGKILTFHTKIVVLCTGGHSRMFKRSSSRFWENNGDGIGLSYDLKADFMDMEMFQFHPTGMVYPAEAEGLLVTEAIRGEGGKLTNAKGERFMEKYDSKRMELSSRDVVARAIYNEVISGRGTKKGGVYLDISFRPKKYILRRLPKMYAQLKKYNKIDISKDKMQVAPTAHYSMGGIHVDHLTGKTKIKNLYAVGEVTAGVHGGNRLGGNSLAEIVVFGRSTGQSVLKDLKKIKWTPLDYEQVENKRQDFNDMFITGIGKNPIKVKRDIQKMMWRYVGVVRNKRGMLKALSAIEKFKKVKLRTGRKLKMNEKLIASLDIKNMIPTCEMIIKSALYRKESRAAQFRSDYPITLAKWKKNIIVTPTMYGLEISTKPVPRVPREIQKFLYKGAKYHYLE